MKISTALGTAGAGAGLFSARVVSWQEACAALALAAVVLTYRLLAERGRRKTLEITYRCAPRETVVFLEEGPGGPAMWIQVGGQRPGRPAAAGDHEAGIAPDAGVAAETAGAR